MKIIVKAADPHDAQMVSLVAQLDDYLLSRYPAVSTHLDPPEVLSRGFFVAAYHDKNLLGCGAIKYFDEAQYGEIKRLFVIEKMRGFGVSKKIMTKLESHAEKQQNINCIRLETGVYENAALGLYESFGYKKRSAFGTYSEDPLSVFMEKRLP